MRELLNRLKYGAAILLFIITTSVSSLGQVLAYSLTNPNGDYNKVYVCKYVGKPGVDEQLQTGNNPIDVSVSSLKNFTGLGSTFNDAQGRSVAIAWDNGDKVDPPLSMCPTTPNPEQIPLPVPTANDPCGSSNATWIQPVDTDTVTWSLTNGDLVASTTAGYEFTDGTTTYDFGVAVDSNTACPNQQVAIPAAPGVNDPCGVGNATWVQPADSATITWTISNGRLIASTTTGYEFTDGTTTHDYGVAIDSNTGCPPIPVTPVAPTFTDECGTANDTYTLADTPGVNYNDKTPGTHPASGTVQVDAIADPGYIIYNYNGPWIYTFTDVPCPVTPAPVTTNDVCGKANDTFTIPTTAHVSYRVNGQPVTGTVSSGGALTVSVNAVPDQDYALTNPGAWPQTLTFTDVPCDTPTVLVCHATDSRKNPYVLTPVSAAGAYNGHLGHTGPVFSSLLPKHTHWGDIIPPFYYNGNSYSLNWDLAGTAVYDHDCAVPQPVKVKAGRIIFKDMTCEKDGYYIVPQTAHVTYKDSNGNVVSAGKYTVDSAKVVTIKAFADAGYKLKGNDTWTHVFRTPNGCGGGVVTPPANPIISAQPLACVPSGLPTGEIIVTVHNPNSYSEDYTVDLGGKSQQVTVAANSSQEVTFSGLAAGTYQAEVTAGDDTHATTESVVLEACPIVTPPTGGQGGGPVVTPPAGGQGGGQVLGESTSTPAVATAPAGVSVKELANTGTSTVLPTMLAVAMTLTAAGIMFGSRMMRRSAASDPTL